MMRRGLLALALACALSPELATLIQRLEAATSNPGTYVQFAGIDQNKALLTLAREVAKAQCDKPKEPPK